MRNLVQSESNQEALRRLSSRGGTEVGEIMNNPNQQNPGQQQQEPGKGGQQGGQGGQRQGGQEQNR